MKLLILTLVLALGALPANSVDTNAITKVCVNIKDQAGKTLIDPRTKQPKQNCKMVKKHKKLEDSKKVPDGKKK
jgi:hypothetical protein